MILTHAHAAVLSIFILLIMGGAAATLMINSTPSETGNVVNEGIHEDKSEDKIPPLEDPNATQIPPST